MALICLAMIENAAQNFTASQPSDTVHDLGRIIHVIIVIHNPLIGVVLIRNLRKSSGHRQSIPKPMPTKIATGSQLPVLRAAPQPFFRPGGTPFSGLPEVRAASERGYAAAALGHVKWKLNIPGALPQRTANRFLSKPLMNRKNQKFPFPLGRGMDGKLELFVKQPMNPPRFVREGTFERHVLQPGAAKHIPGTSGHFDRLRMLTDLKVCLRILVRASRRYRKIFTDPSMPPLEKRCCQR